MYRAGRIALGLEEGELDVGNIQIPDRGLRLPDGESNDGVVKIKKKLQEQELEGAVQEDEAPHCFQIISDQLFSMSAEPILTLKKDSMGFNKTCRSLIPEERVELLYNPVEQKLAVRPGSSEYSIGFVPKMGTTGLCRELWYAMGWDQQCTIKIRAEKYDHLLIFDLTSTMVTFKKKIENTVEEKKTGDVVSKGGRVIFYEPTDTKNPEEVEAMIRRRQEAETRKMLTFGKRADEWYEKILPDSETWNAEPVEIGGTVEPEMVESLLEEIRNDWKKNDCDVDVN